MINATILNSTTPLPIPDDRHLDGIVALGGDLSTDRLLEAYRKGIFPWFNEDEPILWWSPDPRFVLFPEDIKISRSMKKIINRGEFTCTFDKSFERVISYCRQIRKDAEGTWITSGMLKAYTDLHKMGYAHSVETWRGSTLVGGLYGISLGKCFFGESMFSLESNASKAALIFLGENLKARGFHLIDCQVYTDHLATLGAIEIPRKTFLSTLGESLKNKDLRGDWGEIISL